MTRFSCVLPFAVSLASIVATGCLISDGGGGEPLDQDTYFTGHPAWSRSATDCLAKSTHPFKWDCAFELALCADGTASLRVGDVVKDGTYAVEDDVAYGNFDMKYFALEISTATEIGTPIVDATIRWRPDTAGTWGHEPFLTSGCP
jgi:hypothetical protein